MKKLWILMLAIPAVVLTAASAGGKALSPEAAFPFPREAAADGGRLKLPASVGIAFPAKLEPAVNDLRKLGLACGIALNPAPPERALIRLTLRKDGVPEHDQGYALAIDDRGIDIASRTEAGLFYGVQTLRSMLTAAGPAGLPRCRIADSPRFDLRAVAFSLRGMERDRMDQLKKFLRTAAALKYNCAAIEFAENFPYRDDPFHTSRRRLDEADIREIVEFADEHCITIVPLLRIWTDCPILAAYPRRNDLLEVPYGQNMRYSYCPRNPAVGALLGRVIAEQTAKLHTADFFFHVERTGFRQSTCKCVKCRDLTFGKLAAEHFDDLRRICKEKQVAPGFIPSIDPSHRLRRGATVPPRAKCGPADGIAEAPLGHPVLARERILDAEKNGRRRFVLSGMHSIRGGALLPLSNNTVYSLGGLVDGAGWLWSGAESRRHADPTAYFFALFNETRSAPPLGSATAVPLDKAVNSRLNTCGDFPDFAPTQLAELVKLLAGRPEKFQLTTGLGNSYYGVRLAGDAHRDRRPGKVEIALGGVKASALDLLLSCTPPVQQAEYSPWHGGGKSYIQPRIAAVTVKFENGKSWSAQLRYMDGIADWNHPFGGYKLRTAAAVADTQGRYCRFDALRILNPHPELPLKSIVFSSARNDGIAPVLLALSLENLHDGALPAGSFRAVSQPHCAQDVPPADGGHSIQWDFEDSSLKKAYVETGNMKFAPGAGVRIEYPVDTASPSHSRVLKVTVPPAAAENPDRPMVLTVNMPGAPRGSVKALVLSCRVDRPEYLKAAFQSLNNLIDRSSYLQEFFPAENWGVFHSALNNRDTLSANPMRDTRRSDMRKAIFVFRELPQGVCVCLDDIGISRVGRHDLPFFMAE